MSKYVSSLCLAAFIYALLLVNLTDQYVRLPSSVLPLVEAFFLFLCVTGLLFAEGVLASKQERVEEFWRMVRMGMFAGIMTFAISLILSVPASAAMLYALRIAGMTLVATGISAMLSRRGWGRVILCVLMAVLMIAFLYLMSMRLSGWILPKFLYLWPLIGAVAGHSGIHLYLYRTLDRLRKT